MVDNKKNTIKIIVITAILTCLLTNIVRDISYVQNFGKITHKAKQVANIIDEYCLYDVDEDKMADLAATGISLATEDPYTSYYSKQDFTQFNTNISSNFYGVGLVVSVDEEKNKIVVISPVEGGPSALAGILPGDYIVKVDGVPYSAEQLNEMVSLLRGDDIKEPKGTKIVITIERNNEYIDYEIIRDMINISSVNSKMIDDEIAYIRINSFNYAQEDVEGAKDTFDEFKASIDEMQNLGMKKLIIDLRNNPGGNLTVVNEISDMLLPEGVITYTEDKKGNRQDYMSDANELDIPMVVLVNGGSASASEVLTGALKDYKKATVVGTKTFGKGIVQAVIPFNDGSGLSITTSKYYSPNGVCIHGVGIEPDVVVEMDDTNQISDIDIKDDIQLQKAIEILNK